jgi:hypothetical protein
MIGGGLCETSGAHAAGEAALLAGPEPLHLVEHLVHPLAAIGEGRPGGRVVVLAAAHRHGEDEPAAGEMVQRGGLLGDDGGADAVGRIRMEGVRLIRSVTAAAAASDTSGSELGYTMRSIVPSEEKPAASALLAHSINCSPVRPGIVLGRPMPMFTGVLLS